MTANLYTEHCLNLKKAYQKNMALGFGISATFHILAIGTVLLVLATGRGKHIDAPEIVINKLQEIMLPPSISALPEQTRVELKEMQIPPSVGVPEAVPDEEAPEEFSIATQDELANMAPAAPVEDLGNVGINVDVKAILDSLLPESGDFVAFEEMPVKVFNILPVYPPLAQRAQIEGTVWIKVLIDRDGKVRDVIIMKNSGANAGFEEAAVEAAYNTVWKPAISNGQPIAVWTTYGVKFRLRD